jgi:hypothetical protein
MYGGKEKQRKSKPERIPFMSAFEISLSRMKTSHWISKDEVVDTVCCFENGDTLASV